MKVLSRLRDLSAMGWVGFISRLLVGSVLILSGISKMLIPPEELAATMDAYRLLPLAILMPLSHALPWMELALGLCFILGFALRASGLIALGLFSLFLFALISARVRALNIDDCGCFGQIGLHLTPLQAIFMDGILFVAILLCLQDRCRWWSLDGMFKKGFSSRGL